MAHSSYTREDPIGVWLREGLARTLHNEYRYGCSPASLLIPQGAHRRILRRQVTRASGVWGRFLHALAHADLRIDDEWIHLEAPALLELPWYIEGQSPNLPAPWTAKTYPTISNRGWITWADVLSKSTPTSKFQTLTPAWPLAPPSPSSTKANHIPRPNTSADRKGPSMGTMIGPFWRSLPLVMQRKLQTTSTGIFEPTADPALQQMRRRDTSATHFPWHKLLVNGKPWTKTTTRQTRTALNRTTPVIITWPGAAMSTPLKQWTQSWTELHSCPLPNRIISDCYLWLHQRTWLATTDDTTLPCPHPLCTCTDSAHHSFVLCPWATTLWTSALTTVHALGVHYPLSMTPELVALGWPDVVHYRPRLILWRTVVIHLLTQLRRPALSRAKSSGTFSLPTASVDRFRSSLQRLLSEAIGLAWARFQAKQERDTHIPLSVFEHQWTRNSTFVTVAPPRPIPSFITSSERAAPASRAASNGLHTSRLLISSSHPSLSNQAPCARYLRNSGGQGIHSMSLAGRGQTRVAGKQMQQRPI